VIDNHILASNQVLEAQDFLDRAGDTCIRWPWPELDAVTGPMNPGEVWFICAISSGGKTTFVTSAIDLWEQQGRRIYVMPLETRPRSFRTQLACYKCGIHPGDALSGQLKHTPGGEEKRERIITALDAQLEPDYLRRVMVSEQEAINVKGLERGLREAVDFNADIVIVDHIDHIEGENAGNLYAASKAVNHAALRMAQKNDLLLVFTSQLNLSAQRSPDHLARYAPPRVDHVLMPGVKQQIATGMIGLFRKVRDMKQSETPDDYAAALAKARKGELPAPDVLDATVMGVNAMKLRHYGSREGTRLYLGFEHGHVTSLSEKDRWSTASGYPRPLT
jgi:replicative DNA helicase